MNMTQKDISELVKMTRENARMLTALLLIRTSIEQDPTHQRQTNNWMLDVIDRALGDES